MSKHKCAVRDCYTEAKLCWDKGIYFCDKHFMEQVKHEKKEVGIK